jgi:hypothetical protein
VGVGEQAACWPIKKNQASWLEFELGLTEWGKKLEFFVNLIVIWIGLQSKSIHA